MNETDRKKLLESAGIASEAIAKILAEEKVVVTDKASMDGAAVIADMKAKAAVYSR